MSRNFSLQKSATYFSLLFVGATASLLGTNLLPTNAELIQQPVAQLPAAKPGQAQTLHADETLNANTAFNNSKTSILVADSSTNTPEVVEKVGGAGTILGLVTVGGTVVFMLSAKNAKNPLKTSSRPSSKSKEDIRFDQASRKLQQKLLRLLHDDRDTANRLLSQVKMTNPNRSIDWCVEKVIYDLERDRGSY